MRDMKRSLAIALGLFTATMVCGCGSGTSAPPPPPPPPVSVSVSPTSASIQVNATQQFTATLQNDPSNKGVTWALMQDGASCSAECGTLSATSSASGTPTTYTAPATVPSDPNVAIIATPVADTTAAVGSAITITVGTVKLVPASLSFGHVRVGQSSSPQSTTLTNTGNTTLSITSITITGTGHGDFSQTKTCGTSVVAGNSCIITVTFKPTVLGPRSANLSISDNSAGSPQQVPLSGKGVSNPTASVRSALAI